MLSTGPLPILLFSCLVMAVTIMGQGKYNMCNWIECANGGLCQSAPNSTFGYKCRCQFGFTGVLCEDRVNVTTCLNNPCLNDGNCTIGADRLVKCTCSTRFTGARCETVIGNRTK